VSRIVVRKNIKDTGPRQRGDIIEHKGKEYKMRAAIVERDHMGRLTGWFYLILKRIRRPGPAGPATNK